jgi:hypothetical protein
LIASRARWHNGPNKHNLKIGEAIVGDYKSAGLTRREYREALRRLEHQWHQVTTRPTNRGTIVTLTEAALFDLSPSPPRREAVQKRPPDSPMKNGFQRPANGQPAAIKRPLTNKERREERNNKTSSNAVPQSIAQILSPTPSGLAFDRDDWLGSLERLLGPKEWTRCGAMWRMRARSSPEDASALRNAVEDFFIKTPEQRNEINNRGAWLTDRYERNAKQLKKTRC